MIDDLKQYLQVDKHALDEELVRQPSLFYRISELYVEAVAVRDSQKEKLAVIDAEIEQEIRRKLGNKCTEGKVKGILLLDEDHHQAAEMYLDAKRKADQLQALKEAFHMRGYMLRDLAQLFISNYFTSDAMRTTPSTDEAVYKQRRGRASG